MQLFITYFVKILDNMKKRILFSLLLIALTLTSIYAQKNYTLSGYVKSNDNGEGLIGVTVFVEKLKTGGATNSYGFYSVTVPAGKYNIVYNSIGYEKKTFEIDLNSNITKNIELKSTTQNIGNVVVTGEKADANIKDAEMSVVKLTPKEIKMLPVMFGEQDILKTIQLMPGVKSAGEGNTGFYVRGGSADQNLIVLDEAPVYNASHLMGFFSVFNSDAVKDMKLYKGNAPAQYGGRLSSVLDVQMNEGNSKRLGVSGGIGIIASRLTIEAPIVKDRASFIVSGRRTYADMFLVFANNEAAKKSTLYFYDFNVKANAKLTERDKLFVSAYFGRDIFNFNEMMGFDWGNQTGTVRLNHLFGNKLFLNTSLIYSKYDYDLGMSFGDMAINIGSGIEDINMKEDFSYYLNPKNTIKFGFNTIYHTFRPGEFKLDNPAGEGTSVSQILNPKTALESAAYAGHEFEISDNFSINYGLRYANFTILGPDSVYSYNEQQEILDTTVFGKRDIIQSYANFEPRLTLNFILNDRNSIKASYARNSQSIHLLSNATSGTPMDLWIPSSKMVKPEVSDQFAIGFFKNFKENTYETSIEIYYKDLKNQIDYRPGADIMLNKNVEAELVFGTGRAYGVELFIKKRTGKLTGWIGYTLSKTERTFEDIDDGAWYPAKQDRTHDVSIVAMYNITQKLNVSATWVYYTGNAVTFPSGKYEIEGVVAPIYTSRNGYRMPDYHRMDLGITYTNKKRKRFESSWNLSAYNVYSRKNAYSISFRADENNPEKMNAIKLSLFRIIPSLTFNFKF